jgi:hypothetical protein
MVGVRVGVSAVSVGLGVALIASKTAQEPVSMATSAGIKIRKNIMQV